jgi:predicted GNAT family N-acyltransferase
MSKPNNPAIWHVKQVRWQYAPEALIKIRTQVFIEEQKVPIVLEWDGLDDNAQHLIAINDAQQVIGCARVLAQGTIGRMAVLKPWRNQGVGSAILKSALNYIESQGWPLASLSAQVHAISFYQKHGFKVASEPYHDAGIMHQDMHFIFESR